MRSARGLLDTSPLPPLRQPPIPRNRNRNRQALATIARLTSRQWTVMTVARRSMDHHTTILDQDLQLASPWVFREPTALPSPELQSEASQLAIL